MIPFENDEEIARFFSEGEELIHRKKGLRRYLLAVVKAVKKYHTFIKLITTRSSPANTSGRIRPALPSTYSRF